ncbi:glyoxalase [Bacillus phage vB_BanS_Skywalker]|uniref:Glyoxalase n=2 Tax=Tsamsavirus TaxID=3044849 RepID=A0AAE9CED6_9CAUD|nr:glyoxalase [Bacillus phage vB_BanS_Skywalker]YP_010681037.1 glyoxalase/bleomycin resistance/dioxygenase [Bacillus phage vB_BanS_MrDarsey]UGO47973.1 glyoxalase/bleomycin resistance/dioxygenase [Bacillus phage vB_BanS_MrDarsey]UGO51284.1 glyoxalase [Bacillus phage vB_BanS_Skywalker]
MFRKLECVSVPTSDVAKAVAFYESMGMKQNWRIDRPKGDGTTATLVGLKFPMTESSELVLTHNGEVNELEVEILVADVNLAYTALKENPDVTIIVKPFKTESGHVAVVELLDGFVCVLVGK